MVNRWNERYNLENIKGFVEDDHRKQPSRFVNSTKVLGLMAGALYHAVFPFSIVEQFPSQCPKH